MSQHSQIIAEFSRQYELMRDAEIVGPGSLALGAYHVFCSGDEPANIQYCSLEHLKAMARKFLAARKTPDGEENEAHGLQGDLFSGALQDRYPLPKGPGEEPAYKRRDLLTPDERAWNAEQLRKSAKARLKHADALEAEGLLAA
jgi:hypothetical protein